MDDSRKLIVEHPTAQRLADLAGIQRDLELVICACDLFLSSPRTGSDEAILRSKATASFAMLTYFRTLASGVRSGVRPEQIAGLPQELQATHQRLKNVRDQYLAHSINNQEENSIEVTFKEDGTVETLSTSHMRIGTFSSGDVSSLKVLAESISETVNEEYESEFDRVWDFLESLSPEEKHRILSPLRSPVPGSNWQAKRRKFRG